MIQIIDWGKHYENNRTRELKRMQWVPMPNRHDGDGYTALMDHPNGAAHFGAWCALVEVASRCDERGTLLRGSGQPHDGTSLERITRIPASIWAEVLPRLVNIGWITGYEIPQEGAAPAHLVAMNGRNGRKEKKERKEHITAVAVESEEDKAFFHAIEQGFLSHNGGKFTNYALEGKAIHELIVKARARDSDHAKDLLVSLCAQFWKLKQGTDKFWNEKPFLPHILANKLWDMVLESMRRDEIPDEVKQFMQGAPR